MSHTRATIDAMRARIAQLPRAFVPPSLSRSAALVQRLGVVSGAARPAQDVLEALHGRLRHAFLTGNTNEVRGRDLRNAPWVLWDVAMRAVTIRGLLDAIVYQAHESDRTTRNLIEAWLRGFSDDDPSIAAAGQAIRRLLKRSRNGRLAKWQEVDQRFDLFDAKKGPATLARALVTGTEEVDELIRLAGFDDSTRSTGGFMRATIQTALKSVPDTLRSHNADRGLQRTLAILAPQDRLRFDRALHRDVGKGLLAPWLDGGREPTTSHRDRIREFLLKHIGDPRLRASNWAAIGDPETALMRGWLARASLKAFFGIIAEHALDRQWRDRDAFWSAYLEKGAIHDAWLALGRNAHASAQSIKDLSGGYGRLDGAQRDQSVLLLKIGSLILSEWSHNGKVRVWRSDSPNAPRLHRQVYHRSDMVKPCLEFPDVMYRAFAAAPRTSSHTETGSGLRHWGPWRTRAAVLIARETAIGVSEAEWTPR